MYGVSNKNCACHLPSAKISTFSSFLPHSLLFLLSPAARAALVGSVLLHAKVREGRGAFSSLEIWGRITTPKRGLTKFLSPFPALSFFFFFSLPVLQLKYPISVRTTGRVRVVISCPRPP